MKTSHILCAVAISVLAAHAPASAQSVDYGSLQTLFGEAVTTSATGAPQRSTEVPAAMEIISAEDIKRSGAHDIPTILSRVAGVDVLQTTGGQTDVGIRGYDQPYSPRLLILINGRQVYLDDYGFTAWNTLPVQLSEIRQIEVVKGPNCALFGFNAVSGVINIITYNPKYDAQSSASFSGGAHGYYGGDAVSTLKLSDQLFTRLSFGGEHHDESPAPAGFTQSMFLRDPLHANLNSDSVYQLNPKTELRLEAGWSQAQETDVLPVYIVSASKYVTTDVKLSLTSDTAFGLISADVYRNRVHENIGTVIGTLHPKNEITVAQVQDIFKLGPDHTFRLAAEYRYNVSPTSEVSDGHVSYTVFAPSAMWSWALPANLNFTSALRFDYLDLKRDGSFPLGYPAYTTPFPTDALWDRSIKTTSYNVGLVWRPTDADTVRLTTSRGVQVPSLIELGALHSEVPLPGGYTGALTGNPSLSPTTVVNSEIDYDRLLDAKGTKVGLGLFVQQTDQIAALQPFTAGFNIAPTLYSFPGWTYTNVSDSKMWGLEATAKGSFDGGWTWRSSWAYIDITDQPFAGVNPQALIVAFSKTSPANTGNLGLNWANAEWNVGSNVRYVSSHEGYSYLNVYGEIKDSVTLALNAARHFDSGWTLSLNGENLTTPHAQLSRILPVERDLYFKIEKSW